jgi:hypothetical protein
MCKISYVLEGEALVVCEDLRDWIVVTWVLQVYKTGIM